MMKKANGNNRQGKRKKEAWIITAIVVAVILCVVAAVRIAGHTKDNAVPAGDGTAYTTSIAEKRLEFTGGEDPFVEGKIERTPIVLSAEGLNAFETYLSTVQPAYEFSELYQLDEALERYQSVNITQVAHHAHDVRVGGRPDPEALYALVLKNNEEYLKTNEVAKIRYDIPKKKEIRRLCEWICEVLPLYLEAYPEIDADSVYCNLYDLKIMTPHNSFANADINDENIFNFNRERMENSAFVMDTEDIYTTTFYHEMVHLCQICCDCYNNGDEWRVGMGNDYADTAVDPLAWYWLTEAAAEEIESSYLHVGYSTYEMYIGYLTSLDYIAQLDDTVGANRVERLTFSHDMEDIFRMFDIESEEERLEFIRMMYTIDVLETTPDGFCEAYQKKYGVDLIMSDREKDQFRLRLKDDALLSMTKLFYRNLARQVQRGNTTLQDTEFLIRLWENKLCHHCSNTEYGYMVAFRDFYRDYTALQDEFFRIIAAENGISTQELIDGLTRYSINIRDGSTEKSPNCDLAFFDSSEKEFLKKFITEYYWTGRPSIRECITIAAQCEAEMQ